MTCEGKRLPIHPRRIAATRDWQELLHLDTIMMFQTLSVANPIGDIMKLLFVEALRIRIFSMMPFFTCSFLLRDVFGKPI